MKTIICAIALWSTTPAQCMDIQNLRQGQFSIEDGTVLDNKTRLRWDQCSQGQTWSKSKNCEGQASKLSYQEANALVQHVPGGMPRLPSVSEIEDLIAKTRRNGRISQRILPTVNADNRYFWLAADKADKSVHYVDLVAGKILEAGGSTPLASIKISLLWVRDEDEWCAY